jgi:DNA-binding transcriptional regulator YiaG
MNIKETIDSAGLTQYKFSKLLGRPRAHVWKWYHGQTSPSLLMEEKIRTICKEEGITIIEK